MNKSSDEKAFYLPYRPDIRESAEITKLSITYEASAKPSKNFVSLNDCSEMRPPSEQYCFLETSKKHLYKPDFENEKRNALTLFRINLFGAVHGWVGVKGTPSLNSVTHILQ